MQKIRVSTVSYLNSKPFVYGLENSAVIDQIILSKDIPSICAGKLLNDEVDIGLVPVAIIPELPVNYIISDYCIGAVGPVKTVVLFSNTELKSIKRIRLDYHSRTSVTLARILAKEYWKIEPQWIKTNPGEDFDFNGTDAAVIIGDKTFELADKYKYCYDLAEEWISFTGLPFVFACWVANKELPPEFILNFNKALKTGISAIDKVVNYYANEIPANVDASDYLVNNIHFDLDEKKRKGLNLFLDYIKKLV